MTIRSIMGDILWPTADEPNHLAPRESPVLADHERVIDGAEVWRQSRLPLIRKSAYRFATKR
jgi:hypothetical protein